MKTGMNVHEILGRYILADGMDLVMDLDRSHGSWIVDQRDGSDYLDLYTNGAGATWSQETHWDELMNMLAAL